MKKLIPLFIFITSIQLLSAQYCGNIGAGSGSTQCTPSGTLTVPGFSPSSQNLPPLVNSSISSTVIQFKNFDTITFGGQTLKIQNLRIDSLGNLPAGLCWATNKANNTWGNQEDGCIRINGTTCSAPGQYRLKIIITTFVGATAPGIPISTDAGAANLYYYLRVKNAGDATTPVDTAGQAANSNLFISYGVAAVCSGAISVNLGANQSVCNGTSVTLSPNATGGIGTITYSWSASGNSLSCNNCQNPTATITQNSTFYVTATDQNNNTATDNIVYTVSTCGLAVNLGSNQSVCSGTAVTLNPVTSGGTQPYTYSWSSSGNSLSCNNCQNPTATITQNSTFFVTVTDGGGSTVTDNIVYTVTGNNYQITANGPTTFCLGGSVTLNAGSGYTSYQWSNNSSSSTINATQTGTYSVTVTTSGSCTLTSSISVTANAPTITNYQITANGPTSFCSGGSVTLNAGTGFASYNWSNNSSSQTITISQSGTYAVTAVGTDGCTYTDNQVVNTNTSFTGQGICVVSVDQVTGKNVIVWEKTAGFGIDSFKIYKETTIANQYQLIRQQPFGNFSTYEDGQSNPQQKSSRYVITTVDACGESQYSTPHQTIHLTSNVGINNEVNLIWNAYSGINYPSFNVYRGTNQANMTQLTQVSSNTLSYSDLLPPSPPLYYQIEIINPMGCVPTAKTESYGSSLSNVVQLNTLSVGETTQNVISAYSYYNESTGENVLHINLNSPLSGSLKLYDVSGRIAFTISDITSKEIQLPNTLSKGIYVAEVHCLERVLRTKILVK